MSGPLVGVDDTKIVSPQPPNDFELTCEMSLSQACRRDDPLSATHVARPRHEHSSVPDRLLCGACLTTLNYREHGSCLTCGTTFKPASAGFIVEEL